MHMRFHSQGIWRDMPPMRFPEISCGLLMGLRARQDDVLVCERRLSTPSIASPGDTKVPRRNPAMRLSARLPQGDRRRLAGDGPAPFVASLVQSTFCVGYHSENVEGRLRTMRGRNLANRNSPLGSRQMTMTVE